MQIKNISKQYKKNNKIIKVLKNINYKFDCGKIYAIKGESGVGKTTLIKILGLIDCSYEGEYFLDDLCISNESSDKVLSRLRNEKIGFIFQDFKLDPYLTVKENIELPLIINKKIKKEERTKIVENMLKKMNLKDRSNHFPSELSGGEQQRVSIARALINNPKYILCDEPTGNLDNELEKKVIEILYGLKSDDRCIIIVSHSNIVDNYCDEVLTLKEGKLINGTN